MQRQHLVDDRAQVFLSGVRAFTGLTGGAASHPTLPDPASRPHAVTADADGNCWFTEWGANRIGRITADGRIDEHNLPSPSSGPHGITLGPGGTVWTALEIGTVARLARR